MKRTFILITLLLSTALTGCTLLQEGDTDLENPFKRKYNIQVEEANGVNGHDVIARLQEELEQKNEKAKKTIKLSYSVKNKISEMGSTYGTIVLPFEILSLGTLNLLGLPSDFIAQTVYMNATVLNEKGRTIGSYSGKGSAWHTVAVYYGYPFGAARIMADVRAFNKALDDLYGNIENKEEQNARENIGLSLSNADFDNIISDLVSDIISSGSLNKKNGKFILAISDIQVDTMHEIDVNIFVKKLRIALQKEKKVTMSTFQEDKMVMKSRELRQSQEINQKNVASRNTLAAPDISLTGSIVENKISSNKSEYTVMLTIHDLKQGVSIWEGEKTIIKVDKDD